MTQKSGGSDLQPVPMLDFSREFAEIRGEVLAAIEAVCTSQRFVLGPEVLQFDVSYRPKSLHFFLTS